MANEEQLAILKQGVDDWNKWRKENPGTLIDLTDADLSGAGTEDKALLNAMERRAKVRSPGGYPVLKTGLNLVGVNLKNARLIGANLDGANLEGADLSDAKLWGAKFKFACLGNAKLHRINSFPPISGVHRRSFDSSGEPKQPDLTGAILTMAEFDGANLSGMNFEGLELIGSNFSMSKLQGAKFCGARLHDAEFRGAYFDHETEFTGAKVLDTRINRYQLERLRDYGGLTMGDRMYMDIEDGVVTLRSSYSGFKQWIHLIALAVFIFPYIWFVISQWSVARFATGVQMVFPDADGQMPLWQALALFIWNGGINWKTGPQMHWSFWVFVFMFIYNVLRGALLMKTKELENYQNSSGLRAVFSLETSSIVISIGKWKRRLKYPRWGQLYKWAQAGFYIALLLALLNTWHFFTQEIPIYLP